MANVKRRRVARKRDQIGAAVHLLYDRFHLVDRTSYVIEFEAAGKPNPRGDVPSTGITHDEWLTILEAVRRAVPAELGVFHLNVLDGDTVPKRVQAVRVRMPSARD